MCTSNQILGVKMVRWLFLSSGARAIAMPSAYSRQTRYKDPRSRHANMPVVIMSAALFA